MNWGETIHAEVAGIWQAVLGEIELTISRGNFVTWFKNTHLLDYTPEKAIIGVPNIFIKQQLERKYTDLLRDVLGKNGVAPAEIRFDIYSSPSVKSRRTSDDTVVFNAPSGLVEKDLKLNKAVLPITIDKD